MADRSGLEARVRRLLDTTVRRQPASRRALGCTAAIMSALTLSVAAVQDQPDADVVYKVGAGVSAPRVLKSVKAVYPPEAMDERLEGTVFLEAIVNTDGLPSDIKVTKGLAASLDLAAVDALLQWRFEPATLDGKPVRVMVQVETEFRLK
jgi:TonB family protein